MMVAQYIAQSDGVDQVWMVLSPRNPLKDPAPLASDSHRLAMLRIAASQSPVVEVCDIELSMPRPSYTIDTLRHLSRLYPDHSFRWVTGTDNLLQLPRWKDWESILKEFGLIVYPRNGYPAPASLPEGVTMVEAPTVDLSSTFVRESIGRGCDMTYFVPAGVMDYIRRYRLYSASTNQSEP